MAPGGQEASLAPTVSNLKPCSKLRSQANVRPMFASEVGSKCTVLKKVLATFLGLFGASYSHSAPGKLFLFCPSSLRPWLKDLTPLNKFITSYEADCITDVQMTWIPHAHRKPKEDKRI